MLKFSIRLLIFTFYCLAFHTSLDMLLHISPLSWPEGDVVQPLEGFVDSYMTTHDYKGCE